MTKTEPQIRRRLLARLERIFRPAISPIPPIGPISPRPPPPACVHRYTYYCEQHDNWYCLECHQGMGQDYYLQNLAHRPGKLNPEPFPTKPINPQIQ